jgi:hypothetical protein
MEDLHKIFPYEDLFVPTVQTTGPYKDLNKNMLMFRDAAAWPEPDNSGNFYSLYQSGGLPNDPIEYFINRANMRAPKFTKNVDLLTSGCSHTFGIGLNSNFIWPHLVSSNYELTYSNVALPGSSVMFQVISIIKYCKAFGNPKTILCMFPNFERIRVFVDDVVINGETDLRFNFGPANAFTNRTIHRPKTIRLPVDKNLFMSEQNAFYNSLLFIMILEQYCSSNNINLLWSSWSHSDYDSAFKEFFNNYINGTSGLDNFKISQCTSHEDLKNNYHDIYDEAHDKPNGHFGVHWHRHVADMFIKEISSSFNL